MEKKSKWMLSAKRLVVLGLSVSIAAGSMPMAAGARPLPADEIAVVRSVSAAYTLTFEGDEIKVDPITEEEGTVIDLSEVAVEGRLGFVFGGWYDDAAYTNELTEVKLEQDTTVYAKWDAVATYTLSFETYSDVVTIEDGEYNEGTVIDLTDCNPEEIAAEMGETIEDYRFAGWYTEPEFITAVTEVTLDQDVTVYAKWDEVPEEPAEEESYTLSFSIPVKDELVMAPVEADAGEVIDLTTYDPVAAAEAQNLSLVGYAFLGWYVDDPDVLVTEVTLDQDLTVTAKFREVDTYELTFITNNEDVSIPVRAANKGTALDLSLCNPEEIAREEGNKILGSRFVGWYDDEDFTNALTEVVLDQDITVYAKWEEVDVVVLTLSLGDEEALEVSENMGSVIDPERLEVPEKEGFVFAGWYEDAEMTTPLTTITLDGDLTIYAKWEGEAVVSYTLNFVTNSDSVIAPITGPKGTVIDLADVAKPVKEGLFDFSGWYAEEALITPVTTVTLTDGDVTVYAGWEEAVPEPETYTLSFETDGGSVLEAVSGPAGREIDLSIYLPEKEGFDFAGWYEDAALTNEITTVTFEEADVTVYAKWTAVTVDPEMLILSFETNEGSELEAVEVVPGDSVDLSKYLPEKEGFVFLGWYADEALEEKITSVTLEDGDVTVYAKWGEADPDKYVTITFDTMDGEEMAPATVEIGETIVLSDYVPVREDYIFVSWNTEKDGSGETYHAKDEIEAEEGFTLFAMWRPYLALEKVKHVKYMSGYKVGDSMEVRPVSTLTRAEAAAMFYNLLDDATRAKVTGDLVLFNDMVKGEWYVESIMALAELRAVSGYLDGSFKPNNQITRAEFASMASKFEELNFSGENHFADLKEDYWGYEVINAAYEQGWVSGYPDGTFQPMSCIRRGEAASLINNVLGRHVEIEVLEGVDNPYSDLDPNHWSYKSIMEASVEHEYEIDEYGNEIWTSVGEKIDEETDTDEDGEESQSATN